MDTIKNVLLIVVSYIVGRALVDAAFASTVKYCIEAAVQ